MHYNIFQRTGGKSKPLMPEFILALALMLPTFPVNAQEPITYKGIDPSKIAISNCERYAAIVGCAADTNEAVGIVLVHDLKQHKEIFRYPLNQSTMDCVAFSPDSCYIAAGGAGFAKTVRVWNIVTKELVAELKHDLNVDSLVFSQDATKLFCASGVNREGGFENAIIGWVVATKQPKIVMKGHNQIIWTLARSCDGKYLVSGSSDQTVRVWDTMNGEQLAIFKEQGDTVNSVSFSHNDKLIVSAGRDGIVRVIDFGKTGKQIASFQTHNGGIWSSFVTADNKWLIVGGDEVSPEKKLGGEGTVQIWNFEAKTMHHKLKAHDLPVVALALTRDNRTLITASHDKTFKIWALPKDWFQKTKNERPKIDSKKNGPNKVSGPNTANFDFVTPRDDGALQKRFSPLLLLCEAKT